MKTLRDSKRQPSAASKCAAPASKPISIGGLHGGVSGGLRVTVMLGGRSAERDVSLRSGQAVAKALRSLGHEVVELDPRDGAWHLPSGTQVVFLALHGAYGEDGTLQGELDRLGVPYTGSDAEASRVAFDKVLTKERCIAAGVPTARFTVLKTATALWPTGWQPPVALKPVRQGSSIGLEMVAAADELEPALKRALRHDTEVLMEERILGREATVGILLDKTLPVIEVRPKQGILDYTNKYTKGATDYALPAQFDSATLSGIEDAALRAFHAVGARDYARVDVMVRSSGEPVVLEVNTLPGMTELSLLPMAAAAVGYSFAGLCQKMVELALRHKQGR